MPNPSPATERLYRERLLSTTRDVDTRIVLQMQRIITPKISDIYVPLTATGMGSAGGFASDDLLAAAEASESSSSIASSEAREIQLQKQRLSSRDSVSGAPQALDDIVATHPFTIFLGDPGSGKSSFTRWLIQQLLLRSETPSSPGSETAATSPLNRLPDWFLPVPVTLRFFAQALDDNESTSLRSFLTSQEAWHEWFPECSAEIGEYVEKLDNERRTFLILDGLDEAISTDLRRRVVEAIAQFVLDSPGIHVVVTSRVIGYDAAPLPDFFTRWRVNPFTPQQTAEFFNKWSLLIEKEEDVPDQPVDEFMRQRAHVRSTAILQSMGYRLDNGGQPQADTSAVADSVQKNVQELAANPMLSTLIALIHHQGKRLPDDRAELYRLCLEAFVFDWEIQKRIRQIERLALDKFETFDVLEELAFRMHDSTSTNYLAAAEIETIIKKFLVEEKGLDAERASQRAACQMQLIRDRTGLLIARGEGLYGFSHLQFQEYLAGRALVRRRSEIPRLLRKYLWQTRWIEAIVLTAAHRAQHSEEAATEYIQAVRDTLPPEDLQDGPELERLLKHALFTAARCLSDVKRVHFRTRQGVVEEVNALIMDRSRAYLWSSAIRALGHTREAINSDALLQTIDDVLAAEARPAAVEALAMLNSESLVPILIRILGTKGDVTVRAAAAKGLKAFHSRAVFDALVKGAEAPDFGQVQDACLSTIASFASPESAVALMKFLKSDDSALRAAAADKLRNFSEATSALIEVLRSDSSQAVCRAAASSLLALGQRLPAEPLIKILESNMEPGARMRAAFSLILSKDEEEKAISPLIQSLTSNVKVVRHAAIGALNHFDIRYSFEPLVATLSKNDDWMLRVWAAFILGTSGEQKAIPHLMHSAKVDPDMLVRSIAIDALGKLRAADATDFLLLATTEKDSINRSKAARALGELGASVAVPRLSTMAQQDDPSDRRAAINALGLIGQRSSIPLLTAMLSDPSRKNSWPDIDTALRQIIFR